MIDNETAVDDWIDMNDETLKSWAERFESGEFTSREGAES